MVGVALGVYAFASRTWLLPRGAGARASGRAGLARWHGGPGRWRPGCRLGGLLGGLAYPLGCEQAENVGMNKKKVEIWFSNF
jgi:hypothetical protein